MFLKTPQPSGCGSFYVYTLWGNNLKDTILLVTLAQLISKSVMVGARSRKKLTRTKRSLGSRVYCMNLRSSVGLEVNLAHFLSDFRFLSSSFFFR